MAVLVLKQESARLSSGPARHKDVFAERNSRVLIPGGCLRTPVIEMVVPAVRSIKSRSDKGLRQAPGPLGGSVCMFFNCAPVRLFHGSNDIIICCISVIICSK